jgi:multidrug resistance efflux pump
VSVEKSENSPVSPGDVILSLDDRLLVVGLKEAEAALLMARSQENLAKDAFDRVATLKGGDSVSKQQIVESNLKLAQARAGVAQAMAVVERLKIQIADTKIKAEIAGVVRGLPRVKGLFVQFGQFLGYVEATAPKTQAQGGHCPEPEKVR